MSIIEKALDKSEDKGDERKKDARPKAPKAERRGSAVPPPAAPVSAHEVVEDIEETLDPSLARRKRGRPDFPRQTVKQVSLDHQRLSAAGLITPDSSRTSLVEQFRIIKRPVLMKAAKGSPNRVPNGNLVLVTSAVPGEGKTFTAINLAMSIAMELDHTALLVDADVAKSDVSRMLGIDEPEGLMDYLVQPERSLSELLVKTNVPKFTVLPSGEPRANATELLASEDMRRLVDEMSRRYADRVIVIDSPPLLATSGASVLANLVGQTVMVVEAVRTPQSAVREALGVLRSIHNVGLVLNKSRGKAGTGYQYGPYSGYGRDPK